MYMGYRSRKMPEYRMPWQIVLYLVMVVASAAYGVTMSEGYWDYKALIGNLLTFSLCLSYYFFIQPSKVALVLRIWFPIAFVLFWVLLPFMQGECIGRFLLPISFLLILCPLFERRAMAVIAVMSALVLFFSAVGARSTFVRFFVCFAIGLCVAFRRMIPLALIKAGVVAELILPFALFILAATGTFNIFQIGDSVGAGGVEVENSFDADETEDLGADTRTFIYLEEIASAVKNGYVIQGRSLARGYDSDFFGNGDLEMTGRGERSASEVAILNVFNYFGIIGVAIYFLLFIGAISRVFLKSKNRILYVIALYVGFRWVWAFVEDFTWFDLNTICLWIALSMCYSPFFLNMDDHQIDSWGRGVLRFGHNVGS